MRINTKDLVASLEAEGKAEIELEYVLYGKIENFTELDKASSKEEQEQWEIRVEKGPKHPIAGCIRVRRLPGERYILCMKQIVEGKDGKIEVEQDTTADMFKTMKSLASAGMHKMRYVFEIPDSINVWEVDVYFNPDGTMQQWCKVELEVKEPVSVLPPLPLQLSEVIANQWKNRTPEEHAKVDELMKSVFLKKNVNISGESAIPMDTQTPAETEEAKKKAAEEAEAAAKAQEEAERAKLAEGGSDTPEDEKISPPADLGDGSPEQKDPNAEPVVEPAAGTDPKPPGEDATPEGGAGGPEGAEPDNAPDAGQDAPNNDDEGAGENTSEDDNGEEDEGPDAGDANDPDDDALASNESIGGAAPDNVVSDTNGQVPSVVGELMEVSEDYQRHLLMDLFLKDRVAINNDESRRAAMASLQQMGYVDEADVAGVYVLSEMGRAAYLAKYRMEDSLSLESFGADLYVLTNRCRNVIMSMEELTDRYEGEGSSDFYEDGKWVNHDNDALPITEGDEELLDEVLDIADTVGLSEDMRIGNGAKISLEFVRKLADRLETTMESAYDRQKHLDASMGLNQFFNRTTMDQQARGASANTTERKNRKKLDSIAKAEDRYRQKKIEKAAKKGKEADLREFDAQHNADDRRRGRGLRMESGN